MARMELVPTASPSGVIIHNRLAGPDQVSDRLLVMVPGRMYSCDAPALYYLGQMAVAAGFDVLHTSFAFQQTGADPDHGAMLADVKAAMTAVMQNGYKEICIAAKSIGSSVAPALARWLEGHDISLIILTPGPSFLKESVESFQTLIVIGANDPVYSLPECTLAREKAAAEWVVLPDLDHGFNVKYDWEASVAALPAVIKACQRFLKIQ